MNVVYSSSDSYAPIAGVSIMSLLHNNTDADEINIYMIDNNISDENKKRFENMVDKFGRNIVFIPRPDLNKMAGVDIEVGRWNISTFFRLFLCTILPDNLDRCIYLDCDTVVRHSLREFWETDLEDKIVAAVDDCRSDRYKTELNLPCDSTYTNNGVLLIDLKSWREMNVEKDFLHSSLSSFKVNQQNTVICIGVMRTEDLVRFYNGHLGNNSTAQQSYLPDIVFPKFSQRVTHNCVTVKINTAVKIIRQYRAEKQSENLLCSIFRLLYQHLHFVEVGTGDKNNISAEFVNHILKSLFVFICILLLNHINVDFIGIGIIV